MTKPQVWPQPGFGAKQKHRFGADSPVVPIFSSWGGLGGIHAVCGEPTLQAHLKGPWWCCSQPEHIPVPLAAPKDFLPSRAQAVPVGDINEPVGSTFLKLSGACHRHQLSLVLDFPFNAIAYFGCLCSGVYRGSPQHSPLLPGGRVCTAGKSVLSALVLCLPPLCSTVPCLLSESLCFAFQLQLYFFFKCLARHLLMNH